MKSESEIQQEIQLEAAKFGIVLMRNNSGAFQDATGRVVRYGLDNTSKKRNEEIKSSDLIGIVPIMVTPEMVGHMVGMFIAVEVKDEKWNPEHKGDKRQHAQENFVNFVKSKGGVAGIINSVAAFRKLIGF